MPVTVQLYCPPEWLPASSGNDSASARQYRAIIRQLSEQLQSIAAKVVTGFDSMFLSGDNLEQLKAHDVRVIIVPMEHGSRSSSKLHFVVEIHEVEGGQTFKAQRRFQIAEQIANAISDCMALLCGRQHIQPPTFTLWCSPVTVASLTINGDGVVVGEHGRPKGYQPLTS